ncbi:MAG: NAD(P)/FAD-dependent oxidoreductase, partial [Verrucomicrobiota bacterium]
PLTAALAVEKDRGGRLIVGPDLSLPNHPEVFAVGDIASCEDKNGNAVPALASAAIQMGNHVAKLMRQEQKTLRSPIKNQAPLVRRQFAYFDKGIMAIIGKSAAVVKAGPVKMRGFLAWLAWLFVHLLLLVGFRNKLAVLLQWAFAYLKGRRSARIIVSPDS